MENSAKLIEYKINSINMDMDNLQNGENNLRLTTSFKILIPKDIKKEKYIVGIKSSFKNEKGKNILTVDIQGISELIINDSNEDIDNDTKNELVKKHVVPELYEILRKYIDDILEKSHVEFTGIPPFDTVKETT